MSLFTIGKRYQADYTVEHIVPFFNGELAISHFLDERYYLQSAPLVREFTTLEFIRFKKLYDELDLELLLPVSDMFLEGNQAVFVYRYQPIQPLRDVVLGSGVDEAQVMNWFYQIIQTEVVLQSMGIPMYIIRDPRNIGLNADGGLRVIFSGIEDVTDYQSTLNWGTFLYCIASGEYVDESMKKLPNKHSLTKPVAKLLQKCFRAKNVQSIQTTIEQHLNKGAGMGFIGSLFGKKQKSEPTTQQTAQENPTSTQSQTQTQTPPIEEQQNQTNQNQVEQQPFDWSVDANQEQKQDDPISAQLEQMYQSMETEKTIEQKTNMDDTLIYPEQTDSKQTPLDETQIFTPEEQASLSAELQQTQTKKQTSDQSLSEKEGELEQPDPNAQTFTRQPSTKNTADMDETQIFSAGDLSSLEAELEAMHQEQQAEQEQQLQTIDVGTVEPESKDDDQLSPQADDQMQQLEDLFGELEQLQGDEQNAATVEQSPTQVVKPDQSGSTTQPSSNLDSKVQELESLFDEINQLQSLESTSKKPIDEQLLVDQPESNVGKDDESNEIVTSAVTAPSEAKQEREQKPKLEDPLERLRFQFDEEQRALMEEQRKKFEARKQTLIDQAQSEMQRRQQALLSEIEQQEEHILDQLKKDLEIHEQKQLEIEKQEREQLEKEFEKRKQEEMRQLELTQLEQRHEQEIVDGLAAIKEQFAEREQSERHKLEKEFSDRTEEMVSKLEQELAEREAVFKEQKQQEWEQIVKQHEVSDEETTDEENAEITEQDTIKLEETAVEQHNTKSSSKQVEAKDQQPTKKTIKQRRKRRHKNKQEQKKHEQKSAAKEQQNHDELASKFDDHKQEILSGKSGQENATSIEEGAN